LNPRYYIELIMLAAIWGASFLFMRVAAPEFGATNMAMLRVIIAGLTLLPVFILVSKRTFKSVPKAQKHQTIKYLTIVGVGNSILPFLLFAYAALHLEAGLASIVNATTPLWGVFFGVVLFGTQLNRNGWLGLFVGFVGVIILTSHKLSFEASPDVLGILAIVSATGLYGIFSNYSKHRLGNAPALLVASGTMVIASLLVLPFLILNNSMADLLAIKWQAWASIIALGAMCTGFAYILFYRLIEFTSANIAMSVTYLIPVFGVVFGRVFLDEPIFINMLVGGVLILLGVMLTTGLFSRLKKSAVAS
jgi:drug/metabolite transporter (DMT)-like permease